MMARGRRAPLGRCLYCLASGVALSEEHLIPQSLGGTRTLRDAVCEPCRILTGRLEQSTLARDFVIPKTLLALKRRRARKKGPRHLPPLRVDGAADVATALDPATFPRSFTLPTFAPAGRLAGVARGREPAQVGHVGCRLELGRPRGEQAVAATPLVDAFSYAVTIAKWAYGLAVAERGLEGFDTAPIRALLTGARDDVFDFVGNGTPIEAAERAHLHGVTLREQDGWLVTRMAVFASAGMTPYEVVVGRLPAR